MSETLIFSFFFFFFVHLLDFIFWNLFSAVFFLAIIYGSHAIIAIMLCYACLDDNLNHRNYNLIRVLKGSISKLSEGRIPFIRLGLKTQNLYLDVAAVLIKRL